MSAPDHRWLKPLAPAMSSKGGTRMVATALPAAGAAERGAAGEPLPELVRGKRLGRFHLELLRRKRADVIRPHQRCGRNEQYLPDSRVHRISLQSAPAASAADRSPDAASR